MKFQSNLTALLTGTAIVGALVVMHSPAVVALSASEVSKIAKAVTVLIDSNDQNPGSGVLIAREGNTYYVLTAKHVIPTEDKYEVQTVDGNKHPVDYKSVIKLPDVDLVIILFTSSNSYTVAKLANSASRAGVGAEVYISGFPEPGAVITTSINQVTSGQVSARPPALADGYAIVYTNITSVGMSGGPVLDSDGQVIGIHGRTQAQDGGKPGFNVGMPIDLFWKLAPKAYYEQGMQKLAKQDYAGSVSDFSQAFRFDTKFPHGYLERGYARFAQGEFSGAVKDANQALVVSPQSAEAYLLLGAAYAQLKQHQEAIKTLSRAIQLDSRSADAYSLRGVSLVQVKDIRAANQDIKEAIRLDPENPVMFYRRSQIRSLAADDEGARGDTQKAQELAQGSPKLTAYQLALSKGSGVTLPTNISSIDPPVTPPPGKPPTGTRPKPPEGATRLQRPGTPQPPTTSNGPERLRTFQMSSTTTTGLQGVGLINIEPNITTVRPNTNEPSNLPMGVALLKTLEAEYSVTAVAVSPDGKLLASGSKGGGVLIWDLQTLKVRTTLPGHLRGVRVVVFSPDGRFLATSGQDKTVKVWDLRTNVVVTVLRDFNGDVYSIAFSRSGQTIATAAGDGTVKLWFIPSGKLFKTIQGVSSEVVYAVAFSPDGKQLASAGEAKTITLWDLSDGQPVQTLSGHGGLVRSIAFSPDGETLVSGGFDRTIKLWNLDTGELLTTLQTDGFIYSISMNPNGRTFAASSDRWIKIGSIADKTIIGTLTGHTASIQSVSFAPDGKTLVSGSEDKSIRAWQVGSP